MAKLVRVECGCDFNGDDDMEMVKFCRDCRPATGVYVCGECELSWPLFEDLQTHVYNVHLLDQAEPVGELALVRTAASEEFYLAG